MLVLFETPAGYALFKVLDESKLKSVEDIQSCFGDEKSAAKMCVPPPFPVSAHSVPCLCVHSYAPKTWRGSRSSASVAR